MFCGLTRDSQRLVSSGRLPARPNNPNTVLFLVLFALEAAFRVCAVLLARGNRLRGWLCADAGYHLAAAALLFLRLK